MQFLKHYYDSLILLTALWCVLNEQYTLESLLIGLFFSLISLIIVYFLFSNNDHIKNYRMSPRIFIHYSVVLIYQILKSGIQVSIGLFKGDINPKVVHIRTSIHNHWFQCLIANSITLTPGTVTIDKTDHDLQVLWIYPTTDDPIEQAKLILGPFEKVLKKGDYHR